MIKVCHLSSGHSTNSVRILHKECCSLLNEGYHVSYVALENKNVPRTQVKIITITKPKSRWHRFLISTHQVYKQAIQVNAHCYHIHDPEMIPYALKLKKRGKKIIYDVHEDLPRQMLVKTWIPMVVRGLLAKCVEKFENIAAKKFHAVVCATETIQERFAKFHPQVVLVCNYPILDEKKLVEKSDITKSANTVCYVGAVTKARGITEMIQAIDMADARFDLAGKFDSKELRKNVMNMSGWKKTNYMGFLGREEVMKVLGGSCAGFVVLHPQGQHADSLPVKMFEYMLVGLPVIASDFPLWKKIVDEHHCGICVNPLDVREIARAIKWIIEHPEEAHQMGQNGQRAVLAKYNWANEEKALISLYDKLFKQEQITE